MLIVCAIIVIAVFILSYIQYKHIINPVVFINLLFSVVLGGASLGLFGVSTDCDSASLVITVGVILVNIGFGFGTSCFSKKYILARPYQLDTSQDSQILNNPIVVIMTAVMVYFTAYYAFQAVQLFAKGYSLNMVRLFYFNKDLMADATGIEVNGLIGYGSVYLYVPIQYIFIALTSHIIFDAGYINNYPIWRKIIPIITMANIGLSMLTNGGRLVLFQLMACLLLSLRVRQIKQRQKFGLTAAPKKKGIRKILIVAAIAVLIYLAYMATVERNESNISYSLIKSVYIYFCGCVRNLEINLNKITENMEYTFGVSLLSGLVRPVFTFLRFVLKIPLPQLFNVSDHMLEIASSTNIIGEGLRYNAFVTGFYFFYCDAGYIGVVLDSFLLGLALSFIYFFAGKNNKMFTLYLVAMQGVMTMFIRWQIVSVAYSMAFYYLLLVHGKTSFRMVSRSKKTI